MNKSSRKPAKKSRRTRTASAGGPNTPQQPETRSAPLGTRRPREGSTASEQLEAASQQQPAAPPGDGLRPGPSKKTKTSDAGQAGGGDDAAPLLLLLPTTPPRVSFGVEMEFFVATITSDDNGNNVQDPDGGLLAKGLAPLTTIDFSCQSDNFGKIGRLIADCLKRHGFNTWVMPKETSPKAEAADMWTVKQDATLNYSSKVHTGYDWWGVELTSPACYACDEMFQLLRVVVKVLKANFRTAVNTSCGLHVHVGNGPERMDLRALRNYAALIWSAEPQLSMLHCPSRTTYDYSASIRRTNTGRLAQGAGAADGLAHALQGQRWAARSQGRARKLGEAPVASRAKFAHRRDAVAGPGDGRQRLEPNCESDTSDWEDGDSRPFFRPRRSRSMERPRAITEELPQDDQPIPAMQDLATRDERRHERGPPMVELPLQQTALATGLSSWARLLPPDLGETNGNGNGNGNHATAPGALTGLRPSHPPVYQRQAPRKRQRSLRDILWDPSIKLRCERKGYMGHNKEAYYQRLKPARPGTWSGVKELLACDAGAHQLAYLLDVRRSGSNWQGQSKKCLEVYPGHGAGLLNPYMTVESRDAGGSLDGDWIAAWARINCRLLEWARDADPSELMRVVGLLAEEDHGHEARYDVVDLLDDLGLYAEARLCDERLRRAEEAWHECMLLEEDPDEVMVTEEEEDSSRDLEDSSRDLEEDEDKS